MVPTLVEGKRQTGRALLIKGIKRTRHLLEKASNKSSTFFVKPLIRRKRKQGKFPFKAVYLMKIIWSLISISKSQPLIDIFFICQVYIKDLSCCWDFYKKSVLYHEGWHLLCHDIYQKGDLVTSRKTSHPAWKKFLKDDLFLENQISYVQLKNLMETFPIVIKLSQDVLYQEIHGTGTSITSTLLSHIHWWPPLCSI